MLTSSIARSWISVTAVLVAASFAAPAHAADGPPKGKRLDKSFGKAGTVWVSPRGHGAQQRASGIYPAPDGSVYVRFMGGALKSQGNYSPTIQHTHWYIVHYFKNGEVDRKFGAHGDLRSVPWSTKGSPGVVIDSEGRLLITIRSRNKRKGSGQLFLLRYSSRGKIDRRFGVNGRQTFADPARNLSAFATADAVGGSWIALENSAGHAAVMKLDASGTIKSVPFATEADGLCASSEILEVAPLNDGGAIFSCYNNDARSPGEASRSTLLVRLSANGSIASNWATGGRFVVDADPPGATPFNANAYHGVSHLRESPGGGLSLSVYAGYGAGYASWTTRLTPAGKYDNTYGTGGSTAVGGIPVEGLSDNSVVLERSYPRADGSWIISGYWGDDDGAFNALKVSPAGTPSSVFYTDKDAFVPGEVQDPPPVPTPDGKSLYGFLDLDAGTGKKSKLRVLIYRLRL